MLDVTASSKEAFHQFLAETGDRGGRHASRRYEV